MEIIKSMKVYQSKKIYFDTNFSQSNDNEINDLLKKNVWFLVVEIVLIKNLQVKLIAAIIVIGMKVWLIMKKHY